MTPRRAASVVMTPPTASRDITGAIGNTPMVELPRLAPHPDVRLLAKLEGANPTGSVKDRVAWAMLSDARASGALRPGQTILEPSSGNTGISLAMLGARLGHPVRIVMPDNTTREREQLLRLYGAEIVHSPGNEGSNGAIRMAEELAAADSSLFMPYQYGNPANPRVHETSTGPEILAQAGDVDAFVAGLGTGGTLTGVGRFLKPRDRASASSPPNRCPASWSRGCAPSMRASCLRCSIHRSWTIGCSSPGATRSSVSGCCCARRGSLAGSRRGPPSPWRSPSPAR